MALPEAFVTVANTNTKRAMYSVLQNVIQLWTQRKILSSFGGVSAAIIQWVCLHTEHHSCTATVHKQSNDLT